MGEKRGTRPMICFPWPASVMKNGEMKEMRDEGRGCFLFCFCGVGYENLSADRDGEREFPN